MYERAISEDPFMLVYCPNKHKTQKLWDEAIEDCLAAFKLLPEWLFTSEMIKKDFLLLYTQMIIYSILIQILVVSYFLVIKWISLA